MEFWADAQGPPRKKMRKGTKSCTECTLLHHPVSPRSLLKSVSGRRRKVRCIFNPNLPEACNECRLRGSTCIDQERSSENSHVPDASCGEQRYSLRERVVHLENIVQGLVQRLDEKPVTDSSGE